MFQGSIVALVSPMKEGGELDYAALKRLIDWHIENDTDAFVFLGSTGEGICFEEEERAKFLEIAITHVNKRKPVIAGTGAASTAKTIMLTRQAMQAGVDACLVVTPYYNKPPQEGLYRHFCSVSEALPLPLILYNVPSRTACDLLPETVARLSKVTNIVGIKDATGKLERLQTMLDLCGNKINYYSGDDPTALDFMLSGGQGVISITSNIAPKKMQQLCDAALKNKKDEAKKIDDELAQLHKLLCIESNPIPTKWCLSEMGLIPPGLRLPLIALSESHHARLKSALEMSFTKVL
ncbi:MAG: 4-hydroxy-tetrahydrodipicolinate synthase [Gammaproteobacteria bacterium RIFCSPLOWO2_02_FULL_38_11]|nr:MAG: 4-hydroxy-tetrahydrodipicolinate synthase [Gammaproteobacteria bacterium RIFCSPHIGHO2_12_38_15]OGT66818.1 MAG: 4-hydroxy-tetrahydrodipicolinate synthase [Gammaproteobacteria bacterium RIFCSPLOWO2_02_FULL_38_11]